MDARLENTKTEARNPVNSIVNKFVNGARNICWLSGYVRRQDRNSVRICASSDADTGILVSIEATQVVPPNDEYTEVECHLYGFHDPATDRRDLTIKAIHFKRPNISAVPRRTMLQAAAQINKPMATIAEIKEGLLKKAMKEAGGDGLISGLPPGEVVDDLMRLAQRGAPMRGSAFTNKVIITGFIGAKRTIMPTEEEDAHILLALHQYPESARALPVRIYGNVSSFAKELRTLFPINVIGYVDYRDVTGEDGAIRRERFIRTNRQNIGMAAQPDFFKREFPSWWLTTFAEYRKRAAGRRETLPAPEASPSNDPPRPVVPTESDIDPEL